MTTMSERLLICADLGRTLIPNGPQPESGDARKRFAARAARPGVTRGNVSGRQRAQIVVALVTYRLPTPDFVIGDVGTSICRVGQERAWTRLADWEDLIARDWGGHTHGELRALLKDIPTLRLQERGRQGRLNLSFYLPLYAEIDELAAAICERLEPLGVRTRLAWSVDDVTNVGMLDVLPASASRLHAIEALMREQGCAPGQTVFCGDSGSDLEILASRIPSVLVANSRPDVQDLALELAEEAGTLAQLFIAEGGFLGMNGNYAGGVLEGIAHFHPAIAEWLRGLPNGCGAGGGQVPAR
jgi:hydroxymethylpyrimidine pyrophosphatase-like HAD family hydrolase